MKDEPRHRPERDEDALPLIHTPEAHNPFHMLARAFTAILATLALVGALRWAARVTDANTRRVSANLSQMQKRFDQQARKLKDEG